MLNSSFDHTFSYAPLFENLQKLGLTPYDLKYKTHTSDGVILKLIEGKPIMISALCKIAIQLGLELNDVVEMDYSWNYEQSKEFKKSLAN